MSDCCSAPRPDAVIDASRCPSSGAKGAPIDLQTVKALLTEAALTRLRVTSHRFCPDPTCDVVYFHGDGNCYRRRDLRVPVWQKEPFGGRLLCYCFGETEAGIREEIEATGRSHAVERVRAHIAAGRCACEVRNPRGVCCLGDLKAAVERVATAVRASRQLSTSVPKS